MNREEALELVTKHQSSENMIRHSLAVEACMIALAEKLGEDKEKWGLTGLLHDLDYQYTLEDPDNHTLKTEEMLAPHNLEADIIHAVKAHNHKAPLQSKMDIALFSADPTSGFITACALMHPSKQLVNVNLKRMKKRFKTKTFAAGASREDMRVCSKMELELDDFLVVCLSGMQQISEQLGL